MANVSTPPLEVRLIGGSTTSLVGTVGLLGNLLLVAVSFENFKNFRKIPFFLITWQMIIGDLLVISAQLTVAVPITFAGYDVYKNATTFPFILSLMDSYGYLCNMLFAVLLILNRFFIFCAPSSLNQFFFGKRSILITLIVTWVYAVCRTSYTTLSGCVKEFIPNKLHFRPSCRSAGSNNVARMISKFGMYESYALPGIMFVLYMVVLMKVRYDYRAFKTRMLSKSSKIEVRLLVQSILICGVLQLEVLAFSFLPKIRVSPPTGLYINLLIGLISIMSSTTHPMVLFVFNMDVRQGMLSLFKNKTSVQILSMSHTVSMEKTAALVNRATMRRATVMSIC
uniref:G_PROTEIN_RECEP_F1_2 domain-containing protein n=1 Tax=Steinernema glaseri TaxID=37863 RepID=A0A1I7Y0L4_9BILA